MLREDPGNEFEVHFNILGFATMSMILSLLFNFHDITIVKHIFKHYQRACNLGFSSVVCKIQLGLAYHIFQVSDCGVFKVTITWQVSLLMV